MSSSHPDKRPKIDPSVIIEAAISAMTSTTNPALFDVTIICTTDDFQASYWMDRLSSGICKSSSSASGSNYPMVLAVSEDWGSSSGAGNGLGTLYAFQKACNVAKEKYGVDLASELMEGKISAALYHTAGKGTRLAPLPASENNNKPGVVSIFRAFLLCLCLVLPNVSFLLVQFSNNTKHIVLFRNQKLPVCHQLANGSYEPITVLEAVVRQTGIYASSRAGRLSVFWGDQIFVPTAPFQYTPTHHVDIMCTLEEEPPTEKVWMDKGLEKYGVIAVSGGEKGDAAQVSSLELFYKNNVVSSAYSTTKRFHLHHTRQREIFHSLFHR